MKKLVLRLILLISVALILVQCQTGTEKEEINLTNTSSVDLTDKPVTIERGELANVPKGTVFPLVISIEGDTIPSQLDDLDGDGSWDELFFVVDLPAGGQADLTLEWVDQAPVYTVRTSVRFGKRMSADQPVEPAISEVLTANELPKSLGFQRYQTDGPSWENDKVGFRHYLDGRNAKDLFGKKLSIMSPENVGLDENGAVVDNYHVMADWGRDVLAVGNSVGIGGYGLLAGDELMRLGVTVDDSVNNIEETRFHIVTEGPVRSVLNYQYENWKPGNRLYAVEEYTSIWPGMCGYQNSVRFSGLEGDEEMIVGLVNINTDTPLTELKGNDKYVVIFTHDKQTYDKIWWLGLALIVPRDLYLGFTEAPETGPLSKTFLAKLKVEEEKPVTYYAVACWELSDEGFIDRDYFTNYLQDLADQLAAEVSVSINSKQSSFAKAPED